MFIFQSMMHVSLFIGLTVFILIFAARRQNPFVTIGILLQKAFTSYIYLIHLIAIIGILFLNKIELRFESLLHINHDFTSKFYSMEGNLVYWIQSTFENSALTWITSYFYIVIFPALMIASIGVYTSQKNIKVFYMLCYAIIINYIVATPFYLFLQVNEVWSYHPANVQSLIPLVFPTFEQEYRPLSGINNCFPSLHTSISIAIALVALQSKNRVWVWITWSFAAAIIFSIFYLGIHWIIDMLGGVCLGLISYKLAVIISDHTYNKLNRQI